MNILSIAVMLALIIGCGGITSTKTHGNKTPSTIINTSPKSINHIVADTRACNDSDKVWKKLTNSYSIGDRTIDALNSITFQSLSTQTQDIILYYRNITENIQNRPDGAMDIKIVYFPKLDGTEDENKGFIVQASKGFFNSGFYYIKIDSKCYRGEFPSIDTPQNHAIYKSVKLVVN